MIMAIQSRTTWSRYGFSAAVVFLATLLRHFLDPYLGAETAFGYYYCAVAFATWYGGTGPGILATVTGYLLGVYFFIPPRYSFEPTNVSGLVACGTYIIASVTILVLSQASHRAYQNESMKAMQALNMELREQARQLAEMDVHKNEFLAMLGHELRNPLSGVLGGIQVLRMIGRKDTEAEEMRGVVERQANHMARLIEDLLDVSRIAQGKIRLRREKVDLVQVVRQTAENFRYRSEENDIGIVLRLPGEPVWVCADPTRLLQVVGNLIANAVKFTDSGGRIDVQLEADENKARVAVKDTGIGMEPEVLARVFEAFVQADSTLERSRGGLGLGLALAKGIVEMHGGEITAHSDGIGRGSVFCIRLPVCNEPERPSQPVTESRGTRKSHRVLVIDDRRDAVVPVRKMLQLLGHEVAVAGDGESGLAKAKEFGPDVVLCDIGLPDMNGYLVAKALRAIPQSRSAYLVAVTGYGLEEDRRCAAEAGFDFHITKPVGRNDLERLLGEFPRFQFAPDLEGPCGQE